MNVAADKIDLIETIAFDPSEGMPLLELHLQRLKDSCAELGFSFDRHNARNELQAATFHLRGKARVRMLASPSGSLAIELRDAITWPDAVMKVRVVRRNMPATDWRLRHKTTNRSHYRDILRTGGTYEVLMDDDDGYLSEGCFSNIFVERGDRLITPPLSRGVLPGVLRASLIACGEAEEGDLRPFDLERGFFIGNASRGMVAAHLIE